MRARFCFAWNWILILSLPLSDRLVVFTLARCLPSAGLNKRVSFLSSSSQSRAAV